MTHAGRERPEDGSSQKTCRKSNIALGSSPGGTAAKPTAIRMG
jgi:hypothetical protein